MLLLLLYCSVFLQRRLKISSQNANKNLIRVDVEHNQTKPNIEHTIRNSFSTKLRDEDMKQKGHVISQWEACNNLEFEKKRGIDLISERKTERHLYGRIFPPISVCKCICVQQPFSPKYYTLKSSWLAFEAALIRPLSLSLSSRIYAVCNMSYTHSHSLLPLGYMAYVISKMSICIYKTAAAAAAAKYIICSVCVCVNVR